MPADNILIEISARFTSEFTWRNTAVYALYLLEEYLMDFAHIKKFLLH